MEHLFKFQIVEKKHYRAFSVEFGMLWRFEDVSWLDVVLHLLHISGMQPVRTYACTKEICCVCCEMTKQICIFVFLWLHGQCFVCLCVPAVIRVPWRRRPGVSAAVHGDWQSVSAGTPCHQRRLRALLLAGRSAVHGHKKVIIRDGSKPMHSQRRVIIRNGSKLVHSQRRVIVRDGSELFWQAGQPCMVMGAPCPLVIKVLSSSSGMEVSHAWWQVLLIISGGWTLSLKGRSRPGGQLSSLNIRSGTPLTQVELPDAARLFFVPESTFSADSLMVFIQPMSAITYNIIFAHTMPLFWQTTNIAHSRSTFEDGVWLPNWQENGKQSNAQFVSWKMSTLSPQEKEHRWRKVGQPCMRRRICCHHRQLGAFI